MTSGRDKFFYTRTLCCLLKALEGKETEIELKNDSSVKGRIEFVSAAMSVTMRDCVLIVNGRPKRLQRMAVQGRKIRMVLIPDDINILDAMQGVIDMYSGTPAGRMEFPRSGRGRGRSRGRGGGGEGRGRSRGRGFGKDTLQGQKRGEGASGRATNFKQRNTSHLSGRGRGTNTAAPSHSREYGSAGMQQTGSASVVASASDSQHSIAHRLLAVAMSGDSHYSGVGLEETPQASRTVTPMSESDEHQPGKTSHRTSGRRSDIGSGDAPSSEHHGVNKKRSASRESSSERYSDHSSSGSGRQHRKQEQDRHSQPHRSSSDHSRGKRDQESRSSLVHPVGSDDLRKRLLLKKKEEQFSSHHSDKGQHHRHKEHDSDQRRAGDRHTGRSSHSSSQLETDTSRSHHRHSSDTEREKSSASSSARRHSHTKDGGKSGSSQSRVSSGSSSRDYQRSPRDDSRRQRSPHHHHSPDHHSFASAGEGRHSSDRNSRFSKDSERDKR